MAIETRAFDPATYLDNDDARGGYMTEAFETGDPAFIADALGVLARARGIKHAPQEPNISDEDGSEILIRDGNAELAQMLKTLHALGLRLTVRPVIS